MVKKGKGKRRSKLVKEGTDEAVKVADAVAEEEPAAGDEGAAAAADDEKQSAGDNEAEKKDGNGGEVKGEGEGDDDDDEDDDDDDDDQSEGSLDEAEKKFMEKMMGPGKKSLAARAMGLSADTQSAKRGSILIHRRNTGTQLAPVNPDLLGQQAPPSPALGRRELKMRRGRAGSTAASGGGSPLAAVAAANAAAAADKPKGKSGRKGHHHHKGEDSSAKRLKALDLCARAGLADFVKLLKAPKDSVCKNAGKAIDALYQTDSNTVGVEPGGFKPFLKLAQTKNPATQCTALWSLVTIMGMAFSGEDTGTQEQLVAEGGLKVAFKLLSGSKHDEVPVAAISLIGNMVLLESTRDLLVKKYGLKPLVDAASASSNPELLRTALLAVANLASEEELLEPIEKAGAIGWFLEHAKSDDAQAAQAALAGLANVANSPFQDQVAAGGGVALCLPALASKDSITVRAAAQTLANLSQTEANRASILDQALDSLIKLSTSRDTRVQHCVAVCLLNLAEGGDACAQIRDAGGEPAVKKLMFSVDEDVREEANHLFQALQADAASGAAGGAAATGTAPAAKKGPVAALQSRTITRSASKQFVLGVYEKFKTAKQKTEDPERDTMEVLMSKLAEYLDGLLPTPDIVCQTVKDVEVQAAKSAPNDKLLRDSGGMAMLVSMIPEFETHPDILNQVLSTLHVLVRLNPRNILAASDVDIAVEEFLKCLDNDHIDQLNVINLVGALADVQKTRKEIVARGGVEKFVSLLRNPRTATEAQGSSLEVLAKIAIEDPAAQQGIEAKVFDTLFEMMDRVTSTDVQCQLLRLLSALAFNNRVLQEKVRKRNKLNVALRFLDSPNYLIQEYAVRAMLTLIAGDYKNKDAARKADAIPSLIKLLKSKTDMVVKSAVRGLSELCLAHPKNKTTCQKQGGLDALANLLSTKMCGQVEGGAVNDKDLRLHEFIDCTLTTYALECLAVMCTGTPANQAAFATPEHLKTLETLLDSSDLREVYHALNCLAAITKNNKKVKKVVHAQLPSLSKTLAQWSRHHEPKISNWAAKTSALLA